MANRIKYRVLRLTKEQKDGLRHIRERLGENNQTVIANAITIPELVETQEIGHHGKEIRGITTQRDSLCAAASCPA